MSVPDLPVHSITDALEAFKSGGLRPSELLARIMGRIEALDGRLHAYVRVNGDEARRAAEDADRLWDEGKGPPLAGVPISVKDIIDVEGVPTGCGNPTLGPGVAGRDAAVVERLRNAGAVLVGKTHLHEFALGITGENALTGTPRNPHDDTRLPGGSSSGSAVSVAAGMALGSLGTDTGGSIRVPAALCGVVGFKPTFGRLSRAGVFPLSWSMDHVGPIARTVADARLLYDVLAGEDPRDPTTLGLREPSLDQPVRKVAVIRDLADQTCAPVGALLDKVSDSLRETGTQVETASMPYYREIRAAYTTILVSEAATVHHQDLRDRPQAYSDDVRAMLYAGATTFAPDYVQSLRVRSAVAGACRELFRRYDCLLAPTTLVPAPLIGQTTVDIDGTEMPVREALVTCTRPFSMIGLPAVSVSVGQVDGLPAAVQIIGPRHEDNLVLDLAEAVERTCRK